MVSKKAEKMMAEVGGNMAESIGGVPEPLATRMAGASPAPRSARLQGVVRSKDTAQIALDRLTPDPDQPRKEFDERDLDRLASSLKAKGQLQPIRVRWDEAAKMYRIVMGERRYRAARRAGLASLEAVIHEAPLTPSEVLAIQVIENVHRDDLKPVEQARAIQRMREEFGWNQSRVAEELGITQSAVAKSLSLLRLTPEVQAKVDGGKISKKAGEQIARAATPEAQAEVAAKVEHGSLTEDETAKVVRTTAPAPRKGRGARAGARAKAPKARKITALVHNANGIKIEARRGRGFELPELLDVARGFVARLESEIGQAVA